MDSIKSTMNQMAEDQAQEEQVRPIAEGQLQPNVKIPAHLRGLGVDENGAERTRRSQEDADRRSAVPPRVP
jgi:hypothetical protein